MPPIENEPSQVPATADRKRCSSRFAKGTSGNPAGRPRGSRNKATLLMENLLQEESESITRKVIDMAKAGDHHAMRICMDRLLPAQKDRPVHLPLGPVETLTDVRAGISTVVQAISDGEITPTAGETVANVLQVQGNVIAATELMPWLEQLQQQLAAIENQRGGPATADVTQVLRGDSQPREVKLDEGT